MFVNNFWMTLFIWLNIAILWTMIEQHRIEFKKKWILLIHFGFFFFPPYIPHRIFSPLLYELRKSNGTPMSRVYSVFILPTYFRGNAEKASEWEIWAVVYKGYLLKFEPKKNLSMRKNLASWRWVESKDPENWCRSVE